MASLVGAELDVDAALVQDFWQDITVEILHDTTKHLGLFRQRPRADGAMEIVFSSDDAFFWMRRRIISDIGLMWAMGPIAQHLPLRQLNGGEVADLFTSAMNCHGVYGTYSVRSCGHRPTEVVLCPAFVVGALLACLCFRIPGPRHGQGPLGLVSTCRYSRGGDQQGKVTFLVETEQPIPDDWWAEVQIGDDGTWDRWHHSWGFAERWARRFLGRSFTSITKDRRMQVFLELPAASVAPSGGRL